MANFKQTNFRQTLKFVKANITTGSQRVLNLGTYHI